MCGYDSAYSRYVIEGLHFSPSYLRQFSLLLAAVGDFFHSVDAEFGRIDLHSSTTAIVRYASEVVKHVRSEAKLSSLVRTD